MCTLDLFSKTNFEEAAKRMYVVNSCHCFCTFVASNLSQVLCTNGSLAQINLQMKNLKAGIQLYFLVDMDCVMLPFCVVPHFNQVNYDRFLQYSFILCLIKLCKRRTGRVG